VIDNPWQGASFADPDARAGLAGLIRQHEVDVVIMGPLARLGMNDAGTLQEVRDFMRLVDQVRELVDHPVTFCLIHHENKGGKVSGAWEGAGDTLLHVSLQGHGQTRVYVQKARWASAYHAQTLQLVWTDGEGFALREEPAEKTDDDVAGDILAAIGADPGLGWTRVEERTPGVKAEVRRHVRDGLFAAGRILNVAKHEGELVRFASCPPRRPSALYLVDDPTIQHLRPGPDAAGTQAASPAPVANDSGPASLRPDIKGTQDADAVPPAAKSSLFDDQAGGDP
jgi:hypothetical protein